MVLGAIIMACATREYLIKQRGFNNDTFRSPKLSVGLVAADLLHTCLMTQICLHNISKKSLRNLAYHVSESESKIERNSICQQIYCPYQEQI